ncbi:hypothetical protein SAMN05444004_105146 [Jannaschia faecimaris]|uniref:Uncharacterized protein n=1 Tax=Jannaschia faecimaris TaxID=1244108 RepID=A0A1H3PT94_9RHOB|nr:hypothetical protein [Jannaschia faecimaris]SDZ04158.1 hypothetical protein SAMN05444004_105146 [Jannaschia faecimaris]
MMNNVGLPGLLLIIVWVVNVVAFWKLLPRAGMSSYWAITTIFPLFAAILFWVIAFKRWPNDPV